MAVFDSVEAALVHGPGMEWQRALALSLAAQMDAAPNASTAKELRAVMVELGVDGAVAEKRDVADDLAARRAERRQAAGS